MSHYASSRDRIDKAKCEVFLILEDADERSFDNGERGRIEEREKIECLLCDEHRATKTTAKAAIDELLQDGYLAEFPYQAHLPLQYVNEPELTYSTSGLTKTDKEWAATPTPPTATDAGKQGEGTDTKAKKTKPDKPLTKRDKLRNQRLKFIRPRQAKGETWEAIYIAYRKKFPDDETAGPDALRLAWTRQKAADSAQ